MACNFMELKSSLTFHLLKEKLSQVFVLLQMNWQVIYLQVDTGNPIFVVFITFIIFIFINGVTQVI